jgi:hypothetical protein
MIEMTLAEAVGLLGVFLLLGAFFSKLIGKLDAESLTFASLNLVGASLACYASYLLDFMPFVVLQGTWALVAAFRIGRLLWQGRFAGLR